MVRPDLHRELGQLKDFQRQSVDTVFKRLYLDTPPTRRFLVADEVGLGKTLVARGVIARAINHLWDDVKRIHIVYLCSNSDIARQNVARLTPMGIGGVSIATRITLLPVEAANFGDRINVVALTPGTSLNLKGNLGLKKERALLQHMIAPHWELDRTGASHVFAGYANRQTFKARVRRFAEENNVDAYLQGRFLKALDDDCARDAAAGRETLRARLTTLITAFREGGSPSKEIIDQRAKLIGELRHILAKNCIQALEPDLIVLDEFQRFKELLNGEGPAGEMAKELFEYEDETSAARVLLLSATPYKMYTVQDDAGGEDHYEDFLRTVKFLFAEDAASTAELGDLLKRYRDELLKLGQGGGDGLADIRDGIERTLRKVMVRTERLAVTPDRDGMLVEVNPGPLDVRPTDAANYGRVQTLARLVDHADTMEYWKASPWLLNFMDTYKLRTDIKNLIDQPRQSAALIKAMRAAEPALVRFADVGSFKELESHHGRLRWLIDAALGSGMWRLLWLPPTMPYHALGKPFSGQEKATKALLFSAWRVVPRVVAAALSHEAERRMYVELDGAHADLSDAVERLGDLLTVTRKRGKAAGLTALALMYPSVWLARHCDPLKTAADLVHELGRATTLDDILERTARTIAPALAKLTKSAPQRTAPDESWYWAAPILLDRPAPGAMDAWVTHDLATLWGGDEDDEEVADDDDETIVAAEDDEDELETDRSALEDFVERVRETAAGDIPRGVPPKDLLEVLALIAVAGAATAVLRSFGRVAGANAIDMHAARDAAAKVGGSFRTLFNQPDSTAVVRATARDAGESRDYWIECLRYSAKGCLQAVLDEYAHLLVGEAGVFGKPADEVATAVGDYMAAAVGIRRATIGAQNITVASKVMSESVKMRSRFAMRFGEERADEAGEKVRADDVRRAFNSPFWPFVLATTSVGQEGLDFHQYCHCVIHWNLPPNPVDLEQREGRVHRFKGHAVRKNVAKKHPDSWQLSPSTDPWESAFDAAKEARRPTDNDLVPYWVYTAPGGAAIERHVPNYPLSRDVERFKALRHSLVLYRMVFGQPRQEELLAYLARTVPAAEIPALAAMLSISLAPR